MKKIKLKCQCKGGELLYIGDFGDGQIYVAIDRNPKTKKKYLPEVIVDRKKLIELLK